jgi:SET domain-containing protein
VIPHAAQSTTPRKSTPSVRSASSPIHGKGLFATRRIREDAYIATFEGTPTKRNGEHVLWSYDEDDNAFGIRGENELRFLNHSRSPNAEFRDLDLHAVQNIQSGAEVTINYGHDWEDVD